MSKIDNCENNLNCSKEHRYSHKDMFNLSYKNDKQLTKEEIIETFKDHDFDEKCEIQFTNPNLNEKLFSVLGFSILVITIFSLPVSMYFLIVGNIYIKTILISIYIYQLIFPKKNYYMILIFYIHVKIN